MMILVFDSDDHVHVAAVVVLAIRVKRQVKRNSGGVFCLK